VTKVGEILTLCKKSGMPVYEKTDPIRAPIHSLMVILYTEKPVKTSFSDPDENKPHYHPVCQNKADFTSHIGF
jgi:hypothetical protein